MRGKPEKPDDSEHRGEDKLRRERTNPPERRPEPGNRTEVHFAERRCVDSYIGHLEILHTHLPPHSQGIEVPNIAERFAT
ncbi:unnamed protein product [Lampetra fluviatilis]